MKNLIAKFIVFIIISSIIGMLGYAFYMGGWEAFLMFCTALGIIVIATGLGILVIWAFRRVFIKG
jgi:hypothetical protein